MAENEKTGKKLKDIIDSLASGIIFVTYEDVLKKYYEDESKENINYSSLPEYKYLQVIVGRNKNAFDFQNGVDASDGFKYKEGFAFYFQKMEELKQLKKKKEGDEKKQFVTAGLQMLFDNETISEPLVEFECINELTNLSLVKKLYHHLGKNVISFKYYKGYKDVVDYIIHPHLLKEYNSRWFLFGFIQEGTGEPIIGNCSIDRIIIDEYNPIMPRTDIAFLKAPENYYKSYFKDIVGVSKNDSDALPEIITIKTTNYKVHQLVKTKPIHESQIEIRPYVEKESENRKGKKDIQEGEFTIKVIPNIELRTRILSYGSGLYVTGKGKFQEDLRWNLFNMIRNYLLKE